MNAIYSIPNHPCRPSWSIALQQLSIESSYATTKPCGVCNHPFDIMPSHPYKAHCSKRCSQISSYRIKKERDRENVNI
jgi:endogenous inhibitor of DNA gyrase (YacG/DUF329 family)